MGCIVVSLDRMQRSLDAVRLALAELQRLDEVQEAEQGSLIT